MIRPTTTLASDDEVHESPNAVSTNVKELFPLTHARNEKARFRETFQSPPSDFCERRIFPVGVGAAAAPIPLHGDQDADGVPHEVHGHPLHHLQVHAQQAFHPKLRVRNSG